MGSAYSSDIFLERMTLAVRQAGVIARSLEGMLPNEGKLALPLPHDTEHTLTQRSAKSRVDDIVQEVLLLAALNVLNPDEVVLDAEEDTPSARRFTAPTGTLSLVIDPLDGTLAYLSRRDRYSINVGLISASKVIVAIVYFPARDILYFRAPDGQSYVVHESSASGLTSAQPLKAAPTPAQPSVIYRNGRVPSEVCRLLAAQGYTVLDDSTDGLSCPDAILQCLGGQAAAYISHTPQMRDILLGAIVGSADHGYACDWAGKDLQWPVSGRVPRALFGCGAPAPHLIACLERDPEFVSR